MLMHPIVKYVLHKYYPTIQSMMKELSPMVMDTISINTSYGSVTFKFKPYGINKKSTNRSQG